MSAGVQVTGLDELEAALKAMAGEAEAVVSEEMLEAGEEIATAMRVRAERHRFTGLTAEDISVDDSDDGFTQLPQMQIVSIGASGGKRGRSFVLAFLEYGTSKMDPKPIVRPTADEDMPAIVERMNARIEDRVTKAGGL